MARNDPYNPDFASLADQGTAVFDGSASATGAAIISEVAGNGDAELRIQESNDGGSNWQTIAQLTDSSGNTTFTGDFHSQFNRVLVESGVRRLQITNVNGATAVFSVSGDQR